MNKEDEFYTQIKVNDLYRIPLQKPYQLISSGGEGYDWFFKLPFNTIPNLINNKINIREVGMTDSLIIVYTPSIYLNNEMQQAWFVINMKQNIETVFTQEKEYSLYLKSIDVNQIQLFNVDSVFKQYLYDRSLPF